mgnify:CR=1 FL=1
MKQNIHPQYFPKAKIVCVCGAITAVGATFEKLETDICSSCHPFYTGKDNLIDTAGRVERYKTRASKAKSTTRKKTEKRAVKKAKKVEKMKK